MNIKQQILTCLYSTRSGKDFAFTSSSHNTKKRFSESVKDFLKASTYDEAKHRCSELYFTMLDLHDKYPILNPAINRLNTEELFGVYKPERHRLHYSHQANVFLLGLYIFHNFEPLRNEIEREMRQTTVEIQRESPYQSFRYSGGNEYGEFLYRWRLASLCHDIGTGIQLCKGEQDKIDYSLNRLPFQRRINSIKGLVAFEDHMLLSDLDTACGFIGVSDYMKYQELHPYPNHIHHDHGIVGGLIFLRLMHEAYSRHRENPISRNVEGTEVFWHSDILSNSITQIAIAIAIHNLEMYPIALEGRTEEIRIFDMKKHPFSWLLKISDLIQEWDKPEVDDSLNGLPTTNLGLKISHSKILVENFPKQKHDKTVNVLERYTKPNNIIMLESA